MGVPIQIHQLMVFFLTHQQQTMIWEQKISITHPGNLVLLLQTLLQETKQHTSSHQEETLGHNHTMVMITNIKEALTEEAIVDNITIMVESEIKIVEIMNGINTVEALMEEITTCSLREVTLGVTFDPLYILPLHISLHKCLFQFALLATT